MDMKEASSGKSWVSTLEIYVNLVTVCIGVGILALPQLPVRCGYILASLCLALAGLGVHEACLQLWRGLRHCGASTFEALGYEALGHTGRVLAGVMVNLFLLGICSAYAALVGTQLHNLTGSTAEIAGEDIGAEVVPHVMVISGVDMLRHESVVLSAGADSS